MAAQTAPRPAPSARPTSRPVPPRRPTPRAGAVRPIQRALVVDGKNMFLLWLEEKVARRELTPEQAKEMYDRQFKLVKDWTSPVKDAAGSGALVYKMAKDFGTWRGAKVRFTTSPKGVQLVTFYGWPNGRKMIRGTRYRLDNPKMVQLQIGKPGLKAGAIESARFGIYFVVALDIFKYCTEDKATLGSLLGSLAYDIPGVMLASAVGTAAGVLVAGSAAVGAFVIGPIIVAFVVGVVVGVALSALDDELQISERLGKAFDRGLARLAEVWDDLSDEAERRYDQLVKSRFVHDLGQQVRWLSRNIGQQADAVGGRLASFW